MFHIKRNVPGWERFLRVAAGLGLAASALAGYTFGLPTWLVVAAAGSAALTGFIGFCPACAMVGRDLPKGRT